MKAHVIRTAMCGGGLSYDVYVPVSEVANYQACRYTTIGRDSYLNGKHAYYLDFPEATCPETHYAMPQGWDRYEDWERHDKQAHKYMYTIALSVFPELAKLKTDSLPELWVCNLLDEKETDSEFIVDVTIEDGAVHVQNSRRRVRA